MTKLEDLLARFQTALRRELAYHRCPLPAPLDGAILFPRAVKGRATLVHWRRGDSSPADWAVAIRKPHGWCCEIPPDVFLLDLDKEGTLQFLVPRLPEGYGLVQSSPGKFHIWLCGEAPPGQSLGRIGECILEVHGPGRLATLPPSLHIDTGRRYRWLRPFLGTAPTRPEDLDIVLEDRPTMSLNHRNFPTPAGGASLHELMSQLTGQDGHPQGNETAFRCPHHDDQHASLMVNDEKGVFFCHGVGCGFRGNRVTLEKLLEMSPPARRRRRAAKQLIVEVPL